MASLRAGLIHDEWRCWRLDVPPEAHSGKTNAASRAMCRQALNSGAPAYIVVAGPVSPRH